MAKKYSMKITLKDIKKNSKKSKVNLSKLITTFNYYSFALVDALTDTDGDDYSALFLPVLTAGYDVLKYLSDDDAAETEKIFKSCLSGATELYVNNDGINNAAQTCLLIGQCTEKGYELNLFERLTLFMYVMMALGTKFDF